MSPPPRRILFVYEFPPSDAEWQLRELAEAIEKLRPASTIEFCSGFIRQYSPGGLAVKRIANCCYVHGAAFFRILFGRSDIVLVRSAPPLIQMTVAAACRLRGVPCWIWLMDAHPEIEKVLWRSRFVRPMMATLVKLNQLCLRSAEVVIVLDPAMRRRLLNGVADDRVVICPTWGQRKASA